MNIKLDLIPINRNMDFSQFQCGNGILDTEIATNAHFYNITCEARSFAIMSDSNIIGCVIIGLTSIEAQSEENVEKYYAIEIRVLAIERREQRKGYGSAVLKGLISQAKECAEFCGCRYLVLTAAPEKVSWYEKRGFQMFPYKKGNKMFIDFRNSLEYNKYQNQ